MKTTLSEIKKKTTGWDWWHIHITKKRLVHLKLEQYKWSKIEDRKERLAEDKKQIKTPKTTHMWALSLTSLVS